MVDVSDKDVTTRVATARCVVELSEATLELISTGGLKKGDPLSVARVAGIMAAKRTPDLIPLCHPLPIAGAEVSCSVIAGGVQVDAKVKTIDRTGVEMEALTAVTVAALTIYDMVKSVERGARITDVRLVEKSGGRSGEYRGD